MKPQKTEFSRRRVPMTIEDKLNNLAKMREQALQGGGAKRIESQHAKHKLTARERIGLLFDPGTFEEIDTFVMHRTSDFGLDKERFLGDSVVIGYGKVNGRLTFVYSQDFTVIGGTLSLVASEKICKAMDLAAKNGAPCIGLLDSGGARIQEGVDSLRAYGEIFTRNTLYSGVVPQISVVLGPAAGGATYSPAITDFIFMVKGTAQMYITGPDVVKAVSGEEVTHEDLGGAMVHAKVSGNCHFVAENEQEVFQMIRRLMTFLPQNNMEETPLAPCGDDPNRRDPDLHKIVPVEPNKAYNMHDVIARVFDNGDFMEVHEHWANNLIVGFARLNGQSVGIVAQQPAYLAGSIDINASDKGAGSSGSAIASISRSSLSSMSQVTCR